MHHFRKTIQVYNAHRQRDAKQAKCPFPSCDGDTIQPITYENDTMYMVDTRTTYDIFEGRRVIDHRMVIPKRHLETLRDFTQQEMVDHMTIVGEYEASGYNVYSRGTNSVSRSVKHQHTHLIKLSDKLPRGIVFINKPYFLMHV